MSSPTKVDENNDNDQNQEPPLTKQELLEKLISKRSKPLSSSRGEGEQTSWGKKSRRVGSTPTRRQPTRQSKLSKQASTAPAIFKKRN
jgi:hypothetical protein